MSSLFVQVWFYSLVLAPICYFVFDVNMSYSDIFRIVLPTIYVEYWFFTAYIVLLILSPFINLLISNMSRSNFNKLLLCMLILWVVIPTITEKNMYGREIPQFLLLYLLGAYFKKYPDNCFSKKKTRVICTVVCWIALLSFTVIINLLTNGSPESVNVDMRHIYSRMFILILGIAVGMFAMAIYSKPYQNKLINTVSGCTFGVYLIHDNPFVRRLLWKRIFNIGELYSSSLFPLHAVAIVVSVFVFCAIIEFLRQKTIATVMGNALDWCILKVQHLFFKKQ